jgi:colicin import membrane protein
MLTFRAPTGLVHALALTFAVSLPAVAVAKDGKDKKAAAAKEIAGDEKLDKQMDWENKVLGPNTIKKIDLAKIQKLQAEEMARREKQEKLDQAEKDRKEREAAAAAEKARNVKAAGTHEVPEIQEAPPPPKPVEKHDDAFVDKVLSGKTEKKKVAATNDDVDQLLNQAKQDKPTAKGAKGKGDGVDALLATADKQAAIKTKTKAAEPIETVSAEAAAREATLKAIAAAQAKAQEERNRNRRPVVPDAAMLRAQAAAKAPAAEPAPAKTSAKAGWTDPFASDSPSTSSKGRGKVTAAAATVPASTTRAPAAGRHSPSTRPGGNDWQDPFDSGASGTTKPRPAPKAAPARPGKRSAHWKDPFA